MSDSLFALSLQYNVSVRVIEQLNECIGDEISHLTELKIPCKDEKLVNTAPAPVEPAVARRNEELLRKSAFEMLQDYITTNERKHAGILAKYRKDLAKETGQMLDSGIKRKFDLSGNYKNETNFYLDDAEWDYVKARDAYDADLKAELDLAKEFNERKKQQKEAKKRRSIVADDGNVYNLPEEQNGFCGAGGDGSRRCAIF